MSIMQIISLICLLCGLICLVGLVAVNCGRWDCHQTVDQQPTTVDECLKREAIDSLPRQVYKPSNLKEVAECVICLAEFVEGVEVREFPNCCHVFHIECIDTWLFESQSASCPSCRQALVVANQCQTCRAARVSVITQQQ